MLPLMGTSLIGTGGRGDLACCASFWHVRARHVVTARVALVWHDADPPALPLSITTADEYQSVSGGGLAWLLVEPTLHRWRQEV
jgi:hypothetical protein